MSVIVHFTVTLLPIRESRAAALLPGGAGAAEGWGGVRQASVAQPVGRNEVIRLSPTVDVATVLTRGFGLIHLCCLSIHRLPLSKSPLLSP